MTKQLDKMQPADSGQIISIGGSGKLRQRLAAMGVTPGAWLVVRKFAPFGDPMEINVRNYSLSIRKKDAREILVDSQIAGR
jgi:Fe2+ transport system protein FeoA